jgi:hypothetical protein
MLNESETWTVHRRVSPDPLRGKTEKLEMMQENLKIAATTIDALRLEREKLKDSLRVALESTGFKESEKINQKDFGSNHWKAQVLDRERKIEELQLLLNQNRVDRMDWKELRESHAKAQAELIEKDKIIAGLERMERAERMERLERKGNFESNEIVFKLKAELAQRTKDLEILNQHLKDLVEEKEQWTKLYDVLAQLAPEYLRTKSVKEATHKSDWQRFLEIIINLAQTAEKEKKFHQEMQETGKRFKMESNKIESAFFIELKETTDSFLERIHKNSDWHQFFKNRLICSKRFKSMMESHEYPEALLRVLRLFIDFLDQLSENQQFYKWKLQNNDSPSPRTSAVSQRPRKIHEDHFYEDRSKGMSPYRSENSFKQTCWTQTSSNKSPMVVNELSHSTSNKGLQTSLDKPLGGFLSPRLMNKGIQYDKSFNRPVHDEESYKKSIKVHHPTSRPSHLKNVDTSTDRPNILIDSRSDKGKEEGYIKLFDESQQLLSIIDKQNSRLARINNQISQLVPNKVEMIVERDEPSESSNFNEKFESSAKYHRSQKSGTRTIEYENGTFNNPDIRVSGSSVHSSERQKISKYQVKDSQKFEVLKKDQRSEKDFSDLKNFRDVKDQRSMKTGKDLREESKEKQSRFKGRSPDHPKAGTQVVRYDQFVSESRLKNRNPPKAHPPMDHPADDSRGQYSSIEHSSQERSLSNRHRRDHRLENDSDEGKNSRFSSPRLERKPSGLDSSALRIPNKDDSKLNDSKFNESPGRRYLSPQNVNRGSSRSPDPGSDRFGEYARPMLHKEEKWNSVAQYFDSKAEESSSRS